MSQSDNHVPVRMERPTIPFWGLFLLLVAALSAYFGQREATNAALIEIKTEMVALKKTSWRYRCQTALGRLPSPLRSTP